MAKRCKKEKKKNGTVTIKCWGGLRVQRLSFFLPSPSLSHSLLLLSSSQKRRLNLSVSLPELPSAVCLERPPVDSPWNFEEGFDWVHLSQGWVSICQLNGCDSQGPHVTAGVVGVIELLLTGYDLTTWHRHNIRLTSSCHQNTHFSLLEASELGLIHFLTAEYLILSKYYSIFLWNTALLPELGRNSVIN